MTNDEKSLRDFENDTKSFMARMGVMPRTDENASYSPRFVAFLDILGFKDIISEMAENSPNELFHAIVDSYWFHSSTATVDFQLLSDSILITSKDSEPASFTSIANVANNLRNSFLERGILVRGAISFGNHFHAHGILISPALIEAFELESKAAIYPRILCAASVLSCVVPCVSENANGRPGIRGPKGFHVMRDQLPVKDFDGMEVLEFLPDTLEPYFLRTGHHHEPAYTPTQDQIRHFRTVGRQLLMRWRGGLEKAYLRCKDPRHTQKANYLVEKWNNYIRSFTELSIEEKDSYLLATRSEAHLGPPG
jgi:hypothetical protein